MAPFFAPLIVRKHTPESQQASGWASALRVTALHAICLIQFFCGDMNSFAPFDLLTPKEIARRADAQPLAEQKH